MALALLTQPNAPWYTDALLEDHLNTSDVSSTPVSRTRGVSQLAAGTPCTPQECTTMVNAVEQAMNACDVTAGNHRELLFW